MNALELQNICAGYGEGDILHEISFTLESGHSLAILGPNGSGKSTLLRVIAGLLPAKGDIHVCGGPVHHKKRTDIARRVAFMSQFAGADLPYTVYETVLLGRYMHMKRRLFTRAVKEDHQAVRQCIQDVGLAGLEQQPVTSLSGGQMQRVFLARALVQEPEVILLDEPTSHLDLKYQAELVEYLKRWGSETGHTVVGVLHDLNLAMRLADTIMLLKDGRMISYGAARDAMKPDILKQVYNMDVAGYMNESLQQWKEIYTLC